MKDMVIATLPHSEFIVLDPADFTNQALSGDGARMWFGHRPW